MFASSTLTTTRSLLHRFPAARQLITKRSQSTYSSSSPRTPPLLRPALFAASVAVLSFGIVEYRERRRRQELEQSREYNGRNGYSYRELISETVGTPGGWIKFRIWRDDHDDDDDNNDIYSTHGRYRHNHRRDALPQRLTSAEVSRKALEIETSWPRFIPAEIKHLYLRGWIKVKTMSRSQQTAAGIIGLNALVFLAWRIPQLNGIMYRHFTHHPMSNQNYTMLTSGFSHMDLWHFGLNMMGLYSLTTALQPEMGRDKFLAFYLSAIAGAAMGGQLHAAYLVRKSIRTGIPATGILPGLGASGGVYALLTCTAIQYPDASIRLLFFPFFPIPIGAGVAGLIAMDTIGLISGWRRFGHATHLAGGFLGAVGHKYLIQRS